MPPVVLISADRRSKEGFKDGPKIRPHRPEVWTSESYVRAVREAGGLPLLVAPGEEDIGGLLAVASAVVLTGGHFDIHPSWYGHEVRGRLDRVEEARTATEIALARACLERRIPLLGVCGGMQAMAVAAGGTLVQHIPDEPGSPMEHEQPTDPATPWHEVRVVDPAARWLGERFQTNSTHHQAVRDAGAGLVACGWSEDGIVEVIAGTGTGFALGVQGHPELLGDVRPYSALLAATRSG